MSTRRVLPTTWAGGRRLCECGLARKVVRFAQREYMADSLGLSVTFNSCYEGLESKLGFKGKLPYAQPKESLARMM
jgi:hypothetical protein